MTRIATLAALLAVLLVPMRVAADELDPPSLGSPAAGGTVKANPVFAWSGVDRATQYRIQVSPSASFTDIAYTADVHGTTATPTEELPLGTLHWRVAAIRDRDVGAYSGSSSFTRAQPDAPAATAPADDAALSYPSEVPVLRWNATPGSESYRVEVDDEPSFTGADAFTTEGTSYALKDAPPSGATRYWRVRGQSSRGTVTTEWSATRSFKETWSAASVPTLLGPADDLVTPIDDVVFSWSPVTGAAKYQIQVSNDVDFTSLEIDQVTGATRLRPIENLAQDQYYWRVRALQGNESPAGWSAVRRLKRDWLDNGLSARPTVSVPDDDAMVGGKQLFHDHITISWTPVRDAQLYQIQFAATPSFNDTGTGCFTAHTSWTPYNGAHYNGSTVGEMDPCDEFLNFAVGQTFYVRVRAFDGSPSKTTSLSSLWSNTARAGEASPTVPTFTVINTPSGGTAGDAPAVLLPTPNATDTPMLRWERVAGATKYLVAIAKDNNFTNRVVEQSPTLEGYVQTTNTEVRINQPFLDNTVGEPYFWFVLPCTTSCSVVGDADAINKPGAVGSFNKQSVPPSGLTAASPQGESMTLSWQEQLTTSPAGGGTRAYELEVKDASDKVVETVRTDAEGYTPVDRGYADGQYSWRVREIDPADVKQGWSATKTFVKQSSVPTPAAPTNTETLPILAWSPTAFAKNYDVQVFRGTDPAFPSGNLVQTLTGLAYPSSAPDTALPPGTYSWRVRQNDAFNKTGPWSTAVQPFTIGGTAPALDTPADGAKVPLPSLVLRWGAVAGAVRYRVETAPTAGFGSGTASVVTPGTAFAPTADFNGGAPYYWRVSALNADDDALATSPTRSFTAQTAPGVPTLTVESADRSIVATWTAPGDGGSPVTGYVVRYRPEGTTAWTDVTKAGDVLSATLPGLTVNKAYEVSIAARNAVGTGVFSTPRTATVLAVPGPPAKLSASPYGTGFNLDWDEPFDVGGSSVRDYVVRYVPVAGGTPAQTTTGSTGTSLTDLRPGTAYKIEVAARNSAGVGAFASTEAKTLGSAAKPKCKVPKLKRLRKADAKRALRQAHCRLGRTKGRGRVRRQSIKAGKKRANGTKVDIVLRK